MYCENKGAYHLLRKTENKCVLSQPQTDYLKAELSCGTTYLRQAYALSDFKSKLSRHRFKEVLIFNKF